MTDPSAPGPERVVRGAANGLAAPAAAFLDALDKQDLDRLLETFVEDALVNDQLVDYWGKGEIEAWARRDVIADRLSLEIVSRRNHYDHLIITAHVDGEFDKRGLPTPLSITLYFSFHNDRIVQLIILQNQSCV